MRSVHCKKVTGPNSHFVNRYFFQKVTGTFKKSNWSKQVFFPKATGINSHFLKSDQCKYSYFFTVTVVKGHILNNVPFFYKLGTFYEFDWCHSFQ